jgi:hypothetical protein
MWARGLTPATLGMHGVLIDEGLHELGGVGLRPGLTRRTRPLQ